MSEQTPNGIPEAENAQPEKAAETVPLTEISTHESLSSDAGATRDLPLGLPPMAETVTGGYTAPLREPAPHTPGSTPTATVPPAAWTLPASATEPPPSAADAAPLRVRFGPILGGLLLLTFAAYVLTVQLVPGPVDPSIWATGALIGTGAILLIAGIAAAVRRDR